MTLLESQKSDFSQHERPKTSDPFAVAEHLIQLVGSQIIYEENIYRPELALSREKGNCYAWSQLGAIALESWGMPSAVVLSQTHAHVVSKIHNSIIFIDLTSGHANDIKREAVRQNGMNGSQDLERHYNDLLPQAFEDREFTLFFRKEFDGESLSWQADRRYAIASSHRERLYSESSAHLIFDSSQAADVLQAIGDLKRYFIQDSPKFHDRFDELSQYIPDFISFNEH